MSKTATTRADGKLVLEEYEGRDVVRSSVAVTNAGDGLSKALKVDSTVLHHGETCFVVLECEVARIEYPPVDAKKNNDLARKHVLRAGAATIVPRDLVAGVLNETKERVAAFEAAEKEKQQLALDAESEAEERHLRSVEDGEAGE